MSEKFILVIVVAALIVGAIFAMDGTAGALAATGW